MAPLPSGEQYESQTGVKTLPCPKLCLRAIKILNVITDLTFGVVYFFTKLGPELSLPVWAGKMWNWVAQRPAAGPVLTACLMTDLIAPGNSLAFFRDLLHSPFPDRLNIWKSQRVWHVRRLSLRCGWAWNMNVVRGKDRLPRQLNPRQTNKCALSIFFDWTECVSEAISDPNIYRPQTKFGAR